MVYSNMKLHVSAYNGHHQVSIPINPLAYTVVPDATGLAGRLNTQSSARRLRHRCRLPELGFKLVSLGASCVILNGKPMG